MKKYLLLVLGILAGCKAEGAHREPPYVPTSKVVREDAPSQPLYLDCQFDHVENSGSFKASGKLLLRIVNEAERDNSVQVWNEQNKRFESLCLDTDLACEVSASREMISVSSTSQGLADNKDIYKSLTYINRITGEFSSDMRNTNFPQNPVSTDTGSCARSKAPADLETKF